MFLISAMIKTKTLKNGLRVMLKEMHTAPLASIAIYYKVGSRNEHAGITGISHWVEHMMFKGTPAFSEGEQDRLISREGGSRNAFTWIDFTTYYATVPSSQIELVLKMEADRMANSVFAPKEVKSERTVIINERQGSENSPTFRLAEEVTAAAFRAHPYGHMVIGHMGDLERMTREDLYGHYRRFYAPNNAILCASGDFDPREMMAKIEAEFGGIQPSPAPKPRKHAAPSASEPPQKGERRVTVRGEGLTDYLLMAFHAPATTHEDYFALVALDTVLCGASGLSFFGGGGSNRSCRLSRALVDTGMASDIGGGVTPTIDPYLYELFAGAQSGQDVNKIERVIWREIERAQKDGLSQTELDKAIKQTRAQFAFATEGVTPHAFWMGFAEMFANYDWFLNYMDNLSKVTLEDARRVANLYLTRDNVTVGQYIADKNAGGGDVE